MISMKKRPRFTEDNFIAIYQVVSIFANLKEDEVKTIRRGNYDKKNNPLVVEMVDFAQQYFPILSERTQGSVGAQISLCVEACYKDETNWGSQHRPYNEIYRAIHENQWDVKTLVQDLRNNKGGWK